MTSPLRDHARARLAFDQVGSLSPADVDSYRTMAMKLPALIQMGGLATALHFVAARGKPAQRGLLVHLAAHLEAAKMIARPDAATLLAAARDKDFATLRRMTRESLRCLAWNRRFLQADAAPAEEVAP
jgi:CRISPR/Cas system CMR-associated protein Cmr5 small subunit